MEGQPEGTSLRRAKLPDHRDVVRRSTGEVSEASRLRTLCADLVRRFHNFCSAFQGLRWTACVEGRM